MSETTPIPVVRLVAAVVEVQNGSATGYPLVVNVNGTYPPVWWPAAYIPTAGDAVKVLMVDGVAVVHSPVITTQRPITGTVVGTPTNGVVQVSTSAGTIGARFTGTAPANGVVVRLDWQATTAWVWPSAAAVVVPPPVAVVPPTVPPPTPPPVLTTGTLQVVAIDSGTYNARYSNWTGQNGLDLTQGSYDGTAYTGAWFYGGGPQQIRGAVVTATRLRLGARRRMGSYNATLTLNLYLTTNSTKPGGDTNRTVGPTGIDLVPGAPAQWVDIPPAWGQEIVVNGGGLAIAGGTYGGVDGVGADPASGQLQFDWKK